MKTVLTIAGSDPSGGAGIQADLKAIKANGAYGLSCITAITAQNTQRVFDVYPLDANRVDSQLTALFDDFNIDVVKIGMLGTADIVRAVTQHLRLFKGPIVIDPVFISSSGKPLLSRNGINAAVEQLLPLATLITPNITEANDLLSTTLSNQQVIHDACSLLSNQFNASVLIKGGHRIDESTVSTDTLYHEGQIVTVQQPRLSNINVHGTGCTYASAIAAHLAQGASLPKAVELSNRYLHHALQTAVNIGHGALLIV